MDAVLLQNVLEKLQDLFLVPVHAQGQALDHQDVPELVDGQSRQEIRLTEDHTAAAGVDDTLPVLPCVPETLLKERVVDHLLCVARHHPDAEL